MRRRERSVAAPSTSPLLQRLQKKKRAGRPPRRWRIRRSKPVFDQRLKIGRDVDLHTMRVAHRLGNPAQGEYAPTARGYRGQPGFHPAFFNPL
jgi:hypothetical protein